MVKCATCKEISLYRSDWNPQAKGQVEVILLYPQPRQAPGEVPTRIRARFNEAVAVSKTSPSLGGVGLRRAMEELMKDQSAKGKTLASNIRGLADRGDIPAHLAGLIDTVKELQLLGAHAEEPDVFSSGHPCSDRFLPGRFRVPVRGALEGQCGKKPPGNPSTPVSIAICPQASRLIYKYLSLTATRGLCS